VHCATLDRALETAARTPARLLVADTGTWSSLIPGELTTLLEEASLPLPIVLRFNADMPSMPELWHCARLLGDIRDSCRSFDDLEERLDLQRPDRGPSAAFVLLRYVANRIPESLQNFIGLCLLSCGRMTCEAELGARLGMSTARLRNHLCELRRLMPNFPRFPALNAGVLVLSFLWRMENAGMSPKESAYRSGFPNMKALDNHVRYHFQTTASQLRRRGTAEFLQLVLAWFEQ
jgi:hypothetical protein